MPERIFKYHETDELIAGVKELGQLLASGAGATTALKNSHTGFLKESGPVTQQQLRNYFMLGRYEIWLRGQGVDGEQPDDTCASLETSDPLREKRMKIHSNFQRWPGLGSGWWGL